MIKTMYQRQRKRQNNSLSYIESAQSSTPFRFNQNPVEHSLPYKVAFDMNTTIEPTDSQQEFSMTQQNSSHRQLLKRDNSNECKQMDLINYPNSLQKRVRAHHNFSRLIEQPLQGRKSVQESLIQPNQNFSPFRNFARYQTGKDTGDEPIPLLPTLSSYLKSMSPTPKKLTKNKAVQHVVSQSFDEALLKLHQDFDSTEKPYID